jgi:hypothetical protein
MTTPFQYIQKTTIVHAFQWTGQSLAGSGVPYWAKQFALHVTSEGLCVPCKVGTEIARPTDWIVQQPDGTLEVLTNAVFGQLYTAN